MSKESSTRFDEAAASWDENPGRLLMAKQHCEVIEKNIPLARTTRMLDYGCGTGLVSLRLQPRVGSVLGLDGSAGMVAVFREKIRAKGLTNCEARSFDPTRELLPGVGDGSFDLILSTMTFHHIPDISAVLKEFRRALAPGGMVCVLDLASEDGSFHEDPNSGAVHQGFSEDELRVAFASAALREVSVSIAFVHTRASTGRSYPVLMATGLA